MFWGFDFLSILNYSLHQCNKVIKNVGTCRSDFSNNFCVHVDGPQPYLPQEISNYYKPRFSSVNLTTSKICCKMALLFTSFPYICRNPCHSVKTMGNWVRCIYIQFACDISSLNTIMRSIYVTFASWVWYTPDNTNNHWFFGNEIWYSLYSHVIARAYEISVSSYTWAWSNPWEPVTRSRLVSIKITTTNTSGFRDRRADTQLVVP